MDKLKLETMKALIQALPELSRAGAARIKFGDLEVEFREPSAEPEAEDAEKAALAEYARMRIKERHSSPSVSDDNPAIGPASALQPAEPSEDDEDDEETGDPLFWHHPPAQRPEVS